MATKKARRRKATRKAPAPPKFVAIAGTRDRIFALDESGGVWGYDDHDNERWVKLEETRVDFGAM
jgi:hypothetical protein